MYTAVGEAIAKAASSTWEEVVASRIFKPLGMNASNFSSRAMRQAADFSWGYDSQGKKWEILACRDYGGADGAINSNAKDMGQWLRLLSGGGSIDGKRIVSESGFQEMLTKHSEVAGEPFGLGLWIYNRAKSPGIQLYGHPGDVDGFSALFMFAPALKLGFAILTNGDDSALRYETAQIVFSNLLLARQP
jgi:CubicO group peptidase (beta-lactamase class C family)